MRPSNLTLGYAAAVTSAMTLGTLGYFIRNISASIYMITFWRFAVGALLILSLLVVTKRVDELKASKLSIPLTAAGLSLAFASVCYFAAINLINLSSAAFLLFMGPLIAAVLGIAFFDDKASPLKLTLLLASFVGLMLLLDLDLKSEWGHTEGLLWGVGSALCVAAFILSNRSIGNTISPLTRAFYQFLIASLVMMFLIDFSHFTIITDEIWWLLSVGVLHGFIAITLAVIAIRRLSTTEYGTIIYTEPLIASLIGYIIFSESLTLLQFLGALTILVSGVTLVSADSRDNS